MCVLRLSNTVHVLITHLHRDYMSKAQSFSWGGGVQQDCLAHKLTSTLMIGDNNIGTRLWSLGHKANCQGFVLNVGSI